MLRNSGPIRLQIEGCFSWSIQPSSQGPLSSSLENGRRAPCIGINVNLFQVESACLVWTCLVIKPLVVTYFTLSRVVRSILESDDCVLYYPFQALNFVKDPDFGCHVTNRIQDPFSREEERTLGTRLWSIPFYHTSVTDYRVTRNLIGYTGAVYRSIDGSLSERTRFSMHHCTNISKFMK